MLLRVCFVGLKAPRFYRTATASHPWSSHRCSRRGLSRLRNRRRVQRRKSPWVKPYRGGRFSWALRRTFSPNCQLTLSVMPLVTRAASVPSRVHAPTGLAIQFSKSYHALARKAVYRVSCRKRLRFTLAELGEQVCWPKVRKKYRRALLFVRGAATPKSPGCVTTGLARKQDAPSATSCVLFPCVRRPSLRACLDPHAVERPVHKEERNQEEHRRQQLRQVGP